MSPSSPHDCSPGSTLPQVPGICLYYQVRWARACRADDHIIACVSRGPVGGVGTPVVFASALRARVSACLAAFGGPSLPMLLGPVVSGLLRARGHAVACSPQCAISGVGVFGGPRARSTRACGCAHDCIWCSLPCRSPGPVALPPTLGVHAPFGALPTLGVPAPLSLTLGVHAPFGAFLSALGVHFFRPLGSLSFGPWGPSLSALGVHFFRPLGSISFGPWGPCAFRGFADPRGLGADPRGRALADRCGLAAHWAHFDPSTVPLAHRGLPGGVVEEGVCSCAGR